MKRLLLLTTLSILPSTVWAQAPSWVGTWVEPNPTACDSAPTNLGVSGTNALDDGEDMDRDGAAAAVEDNGLDPIYVTLDTAIAHTAAGNVVHLFGSGVYRDSDIDIVDSVTIRGRALDDTIVSDDCNTGNHGFDIDISTGETVILENLTIRGYARAIDASGSSGGTLIVRNCTLIDNTAAGILADSTVIVHVENTRIINSTTAIDGPLELHVKDSEILRNATAGISSVNASPWYITRTRIADNGTGLTTNNFTLGTGLIHVSDSQITGNASHGISMTNAAVILMMRGTELALNDGDGVRLRGTSSSFFSITTSALTGNDDDGLNVDNVSCSCGSSASSFKGIVADSVVTNNGDDGIEIDVGCGACGLPGPPIPTNVICGLLRTTIAGNLGGGIVETTNSGSAYECELGDNSLYGNVGGNEVNTAGPVCTGAGASANQLQN